MSHSGKSHKSRRNGRRAEAYQRQPPGAAEWAADEQWIATGLASCVFCHAPLIYDDMPHGAYFLTAVRCSRRRNIRCVGAALAARRKRQQ